MFNFTTLQIIYTMKNRNTQKHYIYNNNKFDGVFSSFFCTILVTFVLSYQSTVRNNNKPAFHRIDGQLLAQIEMQCKEILGFWHNIW